MEMIFHSHANKTHFHKRGCAFSLILKVRVFGTRKWPIILLTYPPTYDPFIPKLKKVKGCKRYLVKHGLNLFSYKSCPLYFFLLQISVIMQSVKDHLNSV